MFRLSKRKQRGQILVFTALLLPMMILFLVAAACAGMLYLEYTRLQNAADSAALAGATSYAKTQKVAEAEKAIADSVILNLPDSKIVTSDVSPDPIDEAQAVTSTVELSKNVSVPFIKSTEITAAATAKQNFSDTSPTLIQ